MTQTTTWGITAGDIVDGPDGLSSTRIKIRIVADTTDPDEVDRIERAAKAAGLNLEREPDAATIPEYEVKMCSSCAAPIIWAETKRGSRIPIDAQPVDGGDLVLRRQRGDEALLALHAAVNVESFDPRPGERRYVSHFATCPDADQHRRR
jgi:hypothetical protein